MSPPWNNTFHGVLFFSIVIYVLILHLYLQCHAIHFLDTPPKSLGFQHISTRIIKLNMKILVVDPYWLLLVCKLTSSVVMENRWWTPVSVGGAIAGAARASGGIGAVATKHWSGNGLWSSMGGGNGAVGLGWAGTTTLVPCWASFWRTYLAWPMKGH